MINMDAYMLYLLVSCDFLRPMTGAHIPDSQGVSHSSGQAY